MREDTATFLSALHPYSTFDPAVLAEVAGLFESRDVSAGTPVYEHGQALPGLFIIREGEVRVLGAGGEEVSRLKSGNTFGERGLLRDGTAATTAIAEVDTRLVMLPAGQFARLRAEQPLFGRFFERGETRRTPARPNDLSTTRLSALMTRSPKTCAPTLTVAEAAALMAGSRISSLCVCEGDKLIGIITVRDLSGRVLGQGRAPDTPVREVMTPSPITLSPSALGSDVLHTMMERGIGHIPVLENGKLAGIVTQTNLIRRQAVSSAWLVSDIADAPDADAIALVTSRIPEMLVQLVGAGNRHDVVTRLVSDIADAATRRLLALAEQRLGPPPVPYLWLACGSQGRREQTGVSDQDNCMILDDAAKPEHDAYFEAMAKFVTDGLNTAGYVYCPGDMMASAPRWRQRLSVWKSYFAGWITTPSPEAQMLSSVMFDLRPIGGDSSLFEDLHRTTLEAASKNSIFVAHMVSNSLKHQPPLGMFKSIAKIRSGEHKDTVDMKHSGVVPVVDLGRLYALIGRLDPANTRQRLELATGGVISTAGARDLLDAYDLIAETRLRHQARQIVDGQKPDNFLLLPELSDFERSHLRDAFVVVRTMQSAVGQARGAVT